MKLEAIAVVAMLVGACGVERRMVGLGESDQALGSGAADGGFSDAGSGRSVLHVVTHGHQVSGGTWDPNTGASYAVSLFDDGTGSLRTVYLAYFFSGPDLSSQVCTTTTDPWWGTITTCSYTRYVFGNSVGTIPSGDFSATPSSARLHTTTTAAFQGESCVQDLTLGTYTCGPNPPLSFDLAWAANGDYATFSSGVSEQSYGQRTMRTQGTYRSASATVTGTGAGHSFAGATGQLNDSKGTSITHDFF
jgi:hypothetical protein